MNGAVRRANAKFTYAVDMPPLQGDGGSLDNEFTIDHRDEGEYPEEARQIELSIRGLERRRISRAQTLEHI